jgi:hypothetical protein
VQVWRLLGPRDLYTFIKVYELNRPKWDTYIFKTSNMATPIYPLTDIYIPMEKFLICKNEHMLQKNKINVSDGAVSVRYYSYPQMYEMRVGPKILPNFKTFWKEFLHSDNVDRAMVVRVMLEAGRKDVFLSQTEVDNDSSSTHHLKIDDSLWVRGLSSRDKFAYILKLKPYAMDFNLVWSTNARNGCPPIQYYITNVPR